MFVRWFAKGLIAGAALLGACASSSEDGSGSSGPGSASTDCDVAVDRFKELMIVEDAVVASPRASNAANGAWSFRHVIEELTPPGQSTTAFLTRWLDNWVHTTDINGYPTDRVMESRVSTMNETVLCPWLHRRPENACDAACVSCTARELDLASAPFRLVSIVNRMDLREKPDAVTPAGEVRLAFVLTNGRADDPASNPLQLSAIFEYGLPVTAAFGPKEWAARFHQLSSHAAYDEPYLADLADLTEKVVRRGSAPGNPGGSAIAQVRTNDAQLNWIWQLREFRVDATGELRGTTTANTPAATLNGSPALRDFIAANADAVRKGTHLVPPSMLSGVAEVETSKWSVPEVDEPLRRAFGAETCNGCHGGEHPTADGFYHVSPFKSGKARLSPFLYDPANPASDELGRRERVALQLLCPAR